jgi:2,4-dienoyl-CoA reductase (NADPH2)
MAVNERFRMLLSPGQIGSIKTKNRFIKSTNSMGYQKDERDGYMTQKHIAYTEALARGGVGLIITEGGTIDYPLSAHDVFHFRIDKDEYIPGWIKLAEAAHKYDCPIFPQLVHSGPWHRKEYDGLDPIASSDNIKVEEGGRPSATKAATIPQIHQAVDKFVEAAARYKKAGFDGVEINASGNHLLNSFLSRGFNSRHDEYGCDTLENRARIVTEIIHGFKQVLGSSFPVSILFNGMEYDIKNGLTLEETKPLAQIFEKAGADLIVVRVDGIGKYLSSHYPELVHYPEPPKPLGEMLDGSHHGAGGYVPITAEIKKVVKVPVEAVGRLDPIMGEQILRAGKADFIGMTKRLIADPELPHKVAAGHLEDIAPCTACETCISYRVYRLPVRCRINAAIGTEDGYVIKPAQKKKKVLIVGSGPAGLEAARVAATRGHDVTLYEKESKLGGMLQLAGLVKGYELEDLTTLVRYWDTQLKKLGVKVKMGTEFTPAVLNEVKPDVLILAIGGKPFKSTIPGIEGKNVVSGPALHHMLKSFLRFFDPKFLRAMTKIWMPVGKRVVIIGGAIQGGELAEFLVKSGRKVTIIGLDTEKGEIGDGLARRKQMKLVEWLGEKGVPMITRAKVNSITNKGVNITTKEGKTQFVEGDTIVPALPYEPNTELFNSLKSKVPDLKLIGDSKDPRLILDAVYEGWSAGNSI